MTSTPSSRSSSNSGPSIPARSGGSTTASSRAAKPARKIAQPALGALVGAVVGGVIGAALAPKPGKRSPVRTALSTKVPQAGKAALGMVKAVGSDALDTAKASAEVAAGHALDELKTTAQQFATEVVSGKRRSVKRAPRARKTAKVAPKARRAGAQSTWPKGAAKPKAGSPARRTAKAQPRRAK